MMVQSRNNQKVQVRQLIRVRKSAESASPLTAQKPDGLNVCLDCWKRWMLADDRDLSASRMLLGSDYEEEFDEFGNLVRDPYSTDVWDEQLKADNKIGEATGAMIESLNKWQRWAIHKKCGVVTVWGFRQMDYMLTLIEAEKELEIKLRKNLATATQF